MGKALEAIIAKRLMKIAEERNWLPKEQFGNRRHRSTETACCFLTQAVRTTWASKGKASLLQLDLKGAFDRIHHGALIETLRTKGIAEDLIHWFQSYLQGRTATLLFDGKEAKPCDINAGVPQGSPLSLILFILFVSTLYDQMYMQGLITIEFADVTTRATCTTRSKWKEGIKRSRGTVGRGSYDKMGDNF